METDLAMMKIRMKRAFDIDYNPLANGEKKKKTPYEQLNPIHPLILSMAFTIIFIDVPCGSFFFCSNYYHMQPKFKASS